MSHMTTDSSDLRTRVVDDVVAALALALGARRAGALLLDEEGRCHITSSWARTAAEAADADRWLPSGVDAAQYWHNLVADGRPVYVDGGAGPHPGWRADGDSLPAYLATPLVGTDGTLCGVIVVDAPAPSDDHLALAAAMARAAVVAMEQTGAAEAHAVELRRNAVLLDVVREVDSQVELPEVLAAICRKIVEAFGSRQATVYFHSRRHRAALPLADYGTPMHVVERFVGGTYMKGTVPHEAKIAAGKTVVITRDGSTALEDQALLDLTELYALVFVPLHDDDGVVRGLLTVGFLEPRAFSAGDLRALEMVARHAAMAIMRARFVERTAKSARFRAEVSALAVQMNAATSRTETLQLLCARGCTLFGVDSATLLIAAGDRLVASATHGGVVPADVTVSFDDTASPLIRALRTGDVVLENDRPRRDDAAPLDRLRSVLAIPLVERDGAIGVLVFGALRPRLFRPDVAAEAPILGALAAAVLQNIELVGKLHDTNARLSRVSAQKDQFLANVSHDLRTPLNVIIGFAQLALEDTFGEPTAELRQILGRMLASARQQLTLVQDLLDVSRLELNGLTVKPAAIPLAPLFNEMEFVVTTLVRHKPVRVVVEAPPPAVWVHADPDRLRQILTNLLSNAAKFTDEGKIVLRAVAVAGADTVRIDVVDSGIGIPTDQVAGIFEPFRQVEDERAALGTGLGLAIAQRLAGLMRATLDVESAFGRGSTFSVTLPTVAPAAEAEAEPCRAISATTAA